MVKSYAKFAHARSFGVVASHTSNIVWAEETGSRGIGAGKAIVAANEEILVWDVKKGELLSRWRENGNKAEVTCIARSKTDKDVYAVGYSDGTIRLWDSQTSIVVVSFNGHKTAVTALCFDTTGTRLASGSRDTNIIIWDLITEVGLFRLRGHKDQITGLEFLDASTDDGELSRGEGWLLSVGKDTYIKLWELSSQHCVETHIAHTGECWALGVSPDQLGCITAGNDGELKVWTIDKQLTSSSRMTDNVTRIIDKGLLYRQSKERPSTISFHPSSSYVACHGSDKSVEIFRMRTEKEVQKVLSRKRKRKREKEKTEQEEDLTKPDITEAEVADLFVAHTIIRTPGKVSSLHWANVAGIRSSKGMQLLISCTNNCLEMYNIPVTSDKEKKKKDKESTTPDISDYTRLYTIDIPGHRTDIRTMSLSSDDTMLATASNGSLKIWNVKTSTCIRTFECGYALCCSFLPGNKIVVVGTKSGELELFDVASAVMIESVQAHENGIWGLHVHPDGKSVVSGSADKTAKFWNFEIIQEEILGTTRTTPRLRLVHVRTLKVNDDILTVRFTPTGALLAVALLDNTVKVFFTDSLKLVHSLYGHKSPVLGIDISSDSKLIATCSADKNVRLWGLDFGDCHKSFFAHQDTVTQVSFEKEGHNFFSAGRDKMIKYWDGDKFENIMRMDGHHAEVLAMCVSKGRGEQFVVSASHDKSIRVWEETDDQIFLEEERERELEELYEANLTAQLEQTDLNATSSLKTDDPNGVIESTAATKQTIETLMAGERIIEALDLGVEDLKVVEEWEVAKKANPNIAPPNRHIIYTAQNLSASQYLYNTIVRIPASHLLDALLILPFTQVIHLFTFLNIWASSELNITLTSRILFILLKTHHTQIVSSGAVVKTLLDGIREGLRRGLRRQKDETGFNLAGVRVVRETIEKKGTKEFSDGIDEKEWEEEEKGRREGKGLRKRAYASLA